MSAPLPGSHLSAPLFVRPGNLYLAIKLAASLFEATTSGGFGSGLFFENFVSDSLPALQSSIAAACLSAALHHGGFGSGLLH
jgi:hypothetical protein